MARNRKRMSNKPKTAATTTQVLNGQTRTITTTPSGRRADVSKHAATGLYRPIPHIWFQHPVDLPPFTFSTIRAMLMDEGIRLNFSTRAAPLYGLEFGWQENGQWQEGVKCRDAAVGQFVYRQIQRIWKTFLPDILRAQIWGWSSGEVTLKLSEETGLIEINEMLSRHPMDCKLLKLGCEKWGVQITRVEGGSVNLPFPYAWFHAYGAEDGEDYGTSAAYGAYSPWADKWFDGGAKEVRRLFMHKDAYGGVDLGYPDGETWITGYDTPIPNKDLARQITESIRAGGVTQRPSERDEHGNEKWPLTRATVASNPQHILQYPKDLDEEIRHGMEICDDVINSGTTGSWDGKSIPMQSFYSGLDGWAIRILRDICAQVIDPLIVLNYGKRHEYETPFKPLATQAMERQNQNEKQDSAMPTDSPNAQQFQTQAYQPREQQEQPIAMSVYERVGSGELTVGELLSAGRKSVEKLLEQKEPHKFSSTQFNLPADAAQLVREMASRIPYDALAKDGRENEPHITVKYGLHDDEPDTVKDVVAGFPPVRVTLGKASIFPANESQTQRGGEQFDVVKIDVESDELRLLNKLIADAVEHTDTHPKYQPHVTIAYVKPGLGEGIAKLLNDADGLEITFDQLVFSDKNRSRILLDLDKSIDQTADQVSFDELVEQTEAETIVGRLTRLFSRLLGIKRMSADKGERWITIGGDKGNGEGGGFPVKIDKDGKMLTGKFAGSTLKDAFKKGGKADRADSKKSDSERDTAVVNVPLSKRGDLDRQIDKHKAEQKSQATAKRKSDYASAKAAKSEAKKLFEQYGDEIAKSTADKNGVNAKEAKKVLDSMVKWEPEKALGMLKDYVAKKQRATKQLNGVPYPEKFSDSDKFVAGRFAGAIANTDGGNSQQAAMEAINYATRGYVAHELSQPISFVSQRIARVAANAMDPDQKYTKSLLKEWADLHDQLPLSDQSKNGPSSDIFKQIDEQRPLVLDALRLNGFINEPTAAEEEDQK